MNVYRSYGNRHKDCLYMSYCGDFSEVYIMFSHISLQGFGKRPILVHSDSKAKDGRIIRNVSLESHGQILEETRRIENPTEFTGRNKTSKENGQLPWCRPTLLWALLLTTLGLLLASALAEVFLKHPFHFSSFLYENCDWGRTLWWSKAWLRNQPHCGSWECTCQCPDPEKDHPRWPSEGGINMWEEMAGFWVKPCVWNKVVNEPRKASVVYLTLLPLESAPQGHCTTTSFPPVSLQRRHLLTAHQWGHPAQPVAAWLESPQPEPPKQWWELSGLFQDGYLSEGHIIWH